MRSTTPILPTSIYFYVLVRTVVRWIIWISYVLRLACLSHSDVQLGLPMPCLICEVGVTNFISNLKRTFFLIYHPNILILLRPGPKGDQYPCQWWSGQSSWVLHCPRIIIHRFWFAYNYTQSSWVLLNQECSSSSI